ncbi:MAG TPA: hypothetical protein VHU15_07070 [Stellaceae bacterium]|jgi:hypothetical protein|nr:hypothetical protein [Stellaceae bacterium]
MLRIVFLAAALIAASATAQATQQGIMTLSKWKAADLCAKKAQQAFPDFTPEANAKRDAQLKLCLEQQGLPPRAPQ